MSRLKKLYCKTEKLTFEYIANVDKEGLFSTMIPKEIVEKLKSVGLKVGQNRLNNEGYFCDNTLDGLSEKVDNIIEQYSKKELIEEKIVLRYSIDTICSYCKTKKSVIVPNGYWLEERNTSAGCHWEGGTVRHDAGNTAPYGFEIYVEPKLLQVWKFPNGEIFKDYIRIPDKRIKAKSTLDWLHSVVAMHVAWNREVKEIDYTEDVGLFFKSIILYVCNLNEKLKTFFNDEIDIQKAINSKSINLLGFDKLK